MPDSRSLPLSQIDLATGKRRPALLLLPLPTDYDDWPICMMSTKTEQAVLDIDDIISTSDSISKPLA